MRLTRFRMHGRGSSSSASNFAGFDEKSDRLPRLRRCPENHYDTAYASDGFSAVMMAQKEHPNLIILDIGLPAGDGFVVLERLQKNPSLACIPVIVLTARDPQFNKERTLKAGAIAFLQKPADNSELLEAISAALNQPPDSAALS